MLSNSMKTLMSSWTIMDSPFNAGICKRMAIAAILPFPCAVITYGNYDGRISMSIIKEEDNQTYTITAKSLVALSAGEYDIKKDS